MEQNFFKREGTVLSDGLAGGLQDTLQTTWSDLKKSGAEFSSNPIAAAGNFVENHWQDAVVGAGVAAADIKNPYANAAMAVYAARGLIGAIGSATWQAGASDADTGKIAADLKTSVAHEGTAFLSSMPVAMAGGMVGKVSMNALVGKDLGLSDVVGGKVSLDQVKDNFWKVNDTLNPPKMKMLVTDIDGTVGPFADYFAPAIKENVERLSSQTGLSQGDIYRTIGHQMDINRTHDYPWSLERSDLRQQLKMTPEQFNQEVVKPWWENIYRHREQMKPFEGAAETLQTLNDKGVYVMARSDAPFYAAARRSEAMGVTGNFDEFNALQAKVPSPENLSDPSLFEHGMKLVRDEEQKAATNFSKYSVLPKSDEKPNIGNLTERINELGLRQSQVAMIGDSRIKDGGLAKAAGIKFVYAKFGANPAMEFQDTFTELSAGAVNVRPATALPDTMTAPRKVYPPIYMEAQQYSDVLQLLSPKRDWSAIGNMVKENSFVIPSFKPLAAYSIPLERKEDRS